MKRKADPAEFGGGRELGEKLYSARGVAQLLCSRAGCGRRAHAVWGACADANRQRPLCPECDVELNEVALTFLGDPELAAKMVEYRARIQKQIGRALTQ